jgi:uncharacterized membrane protein
MSYWLERLHRLHRFLAAQAGYAVLLSTLLAVSLLVGRALLVQQLDHGGASLPGTAIQPNPVRPLQFGPLTLFVSAWRDQQERSFVQASVEANLGHALQLYWQQLIGLSQFGALRVLLNAWTAGYDSTIVRFLMEVSISQALIYAFLAWNLILAWIPYLSSLWAARLYLRHPGRWWPLVVPGVLWLLFFPNAPYIVTDFLHLRERAPIPIWYDIGLLMAFAWSGLFLGIFSLRTMQRLVQAFLGRAAGWLFALGSLALGGLGIYIGRFLRWNSWDLLLHPSDVVTDVALRLADPWNHPGALGVTLLFAAFLLVCYLTLVPALSSVELDESLA